MSTAVISNHGRWIVLAIAASTTLAASLLLEVNVYLTLLVVLLVAAVGAIGFLVQFGSPFLGLVVLVGTAVAFPLEFRGPGGVVMGSSLPLAAVLCGTWLFRVAISRGSLELSRVVYAILALMGASLISFAIGQFPWFGVGGAPLGAQVVELGFFLLSGLLFLSVGHQLQSLTQLKWLTAILIGTGLVAAIIHTFPDQLALIGRLTTRPGSIGSLFWTWLVALSLGQALFNRRLPMSWRVGLVCVTVLVFFHGLVQVRSWASGWIPPLAALGVILFVRFPRFSFGLGVLAIPAALLFGGDFVTALVGEESYSLSTRGGALTTLWRLVELSPIFGTGPANYYYLTENMQIMGWYVRFISHNNYQDLLMQTGLVGLLAFVWFACEALWMTWRTTRQAPAGFARAYAVGALGGLVGSLVSGLLGDWIIPFYYNAGILGFRSSLLMWVFLGGVFALQRLVADSVEVEEAEFSDAAPLSHGYRRYQQADWA